MISDFSGDGGSEMTPKNWILGGMRGQKSSKLVGVIINGCSLSLRVAEL